MVNFQLYDQNVFKTGINIGPGGYELIAEFNLTGKIEDTSSIFKTRVTSGNAVIYYDEVQDSAIGPTAKPIGALTLQSGSCAITAVNVGPGQPDGSCSLMFSFDTLTPTAPGVWTLSPSGPDLGQLNSTFIIDTDVDEITSVFTEYPGFGVTCDIDKDGGPDACSHSLSASYDGSGVFHVPEPSTALLLGLGLLGIGAQAHNRRRPQALAS